MPESQFRWHQEGKITDEMVDRFRSRLGRKWLNERLIDRAAVDSFVRGIGDSNPLWMDEAKGAKTAYGAPIAPPSILIKVHLGVVQQGLRGVHAFHSATRWEFLAPIYRNDLISADTEFTDLVDKRMDHFAPRTLIEHYATVFSNQRGEIVGRAHGEIIRAERAGMKSRGRYKGIVVPHPWTDDQRTELEVATAREDEQVRGDKPLFWEDVEVGQELPTLVKGPIRMWDMMAWFSAGRGFDGFSYTSREMLRTPAYGLLHPASNSREPIEIVHLENEAAKTAGLPGAYDLGAGRQSYMIQALTHSIGDDAWVKSNKCQYRRFVFIGDALFFRNTVIRKWIEADGEHCVEVEGGAYNQRDENTMPSLSVIALPSKTASVTPAARRAALTQAAGR